MATSFSPYVTVYDKRTKMGHLVYRASLQSFLKSGNYTTEKPDGAIASATLKQSQLPTAGREANRLPALQNMQTPGLETDPPISAVVRPEIAPDLKETNAQRHLREIEEPTETPAEPDTTPTVEASNESKPSRSQPRRRAKAKTSTEASTSSEE